MKTKTEIPSCKNFSGYKPCYPDHNCWTDGCKDNKPIGHKILIINLDAMGDVLMTTAQLPAIKKKFPDSTIYWITLKNAAPLLQQNQFIDKIFIYDTESILILNQIEFDIVMNVDKSQRSCALLNSVNAKEKLGFGLDKNGVIVPVNKGANYNYNLGMDDNLKFKVNQRTGQDYLAETLDLEYIRNDYTFNFTTDELRYIEDYKKQVRLRETDKIIGFNTGCSELYPNKKMSVGQHIFLINKFLSKRKYKIMLLGGPEDTARNKEIADYFKGRVINTPTTNGVRKGACYEAIPQVIITGDTFGMHLAIALKKYVIAWFGLSCWTEIDLYDRGVKIYQEDLFCSPCWKKECPYDLECIKNLDLNRMIIETEKYFEDFDIAKVKERDNIFERAKKLKRPLILDGAMGSVLQEKKLTPNKRVWSATANDDSKSEVITLHKDYIRAGADIITTNTFRTNPYALISTGVTDIVGSVSNAVELAKRARGKSSVLIAGSNPPAEDCYQVERTISQKDLEWNHKVHIDALMESGCDFIMNETQSHFDEIKFISKYCGENHIPYIMNFFFVDKPKLLSGENLTDAIEYVLKYHPLAIGFNCITFEAFDNAVKRLKPELAWGFYLNCGSGKFTDNKIDCAVSPLEYAKLVKPYLAYNPSFIGSCCGSSPEHTKKLKSLIDG
ncbi:MAG: homocysteine S-methyltransferase family protein [Ignavibacteriaceae bacterium]|nr:homocysteine S-methyltransferase family protein [Ignavibacterium sp.]MCC6254074.1 homocysteine S-methyltransferase family protein [Ignavibacteriaceae bacterium]HRN25130.1 homocysteine S-methyltransferase family protein [Ignavibacteriaceae bacterium]HRQ54126.1 homocysteine S-methyltransferase family protein [Ignavibacteriaceae bacterium]